MSNYITRPAIDRKAGKTDIEQLMPYLQNELATVRSNDNAKIAALTEMESNAMANPEAYRGTEFHIDSSGFTNMNEKAKSLMRPKDGIDYSQDAINESSDVINRELTDQLTTDAVDKIANTEERKTAADKAKEIGQIDTNKLAQLAVHGKGSQGQDLINKGIATTTPPATQPTEGSIATTSNTPTTQPTTGTGYNPATGTLSQNIAYMAGVTPDPNIKSPATSATQTATGTTTTPTQPDPLKTGTAAEKANELAKQNPGMGAGAKDKTETGSSHGESEDWTLTTDIGVGKSNIKTDAVHDIKTTQRAGIIDQDAVDLKSLKVAAGIESIRNRALAGRPGATPITTVANRLQAREAFLTDIQNKRGVVTSTKQTGGNVDAGLGEMNAKFTAKRGVDQRNSIKNVVSNGANLSTGGVRDPNADTVTGTGTAGENLEFRRTANGKITGDITQPTQIAINSRLRGSDALGGFYRNKPRVENGVKFYPTGWKNVELVVKDGDHPYFEAKPGFEIPETMYKKFAADAGSGGIKNNVNRNVDQSGFDASQGSTGQSNRRYK